MQTLIIDNYDSFTYNLYQLAGAITGSEPAVIPNDSTACINPADFDCVIISPGPGRPDRVEDFGISRRALLEWDLPLLGVCLGHQGICHVLGGSVIHAQEPVHGLLSSVHHDGSALFQGVPNPFSAVRYHSLVCAQPLPEPLVATAWTTDGVLMALAHRTRPIWGVQFHPESICTENGRTILANFLKLSGNARRTAPCAIQAASRPAPPRASHGQVFVRRIPVKVDPAQLFSALFADQEYAFWLDSSLPSSRARFSFMGGASGAGAEAVRYHAASPDEDLLAYLTRRLRQRQIITPDLPFDFNCGYVGYFGYELKALCGAPATRRSLQPDGALLFADRCLAIDHQNDEVYLLYLGDGGSASAWFDQITPHLDREYPEEPAAWPAGRFTASRSRSTYLNNIAKCLQYIRDGESYEVCLTNQMRARFAGDPLAFYRRLRRLNPAPYSAFLKFPEMAVACSSPECFLKVRPSGAVETRPIKGTIRRGAHAAEDQSLRQRLRNDIKNQAENLMIVDLLRNDLGRVCEIGSVQVPELMQVETYATVHQLVSTVTGQLQPGCSAIDGFRAAFPGGSMTGAPKLRTMAIIDELEQEPRGVYSGSIGYFALNGSADLNIVIRSAVFADQGVSIGAGGAIVALSDPDDEWNELLLKAQAVLAAFQSDSQPWAAHR